jgi:hypothetical protein
MFGSWLVEATSCHGCHGAKENTKARPEVSNRGSGCFELSTGKFKHDIANGLQWFTNRTVCT